jgi:sugar lactone lactonase YvrE/dienelactone hydrolase
MQQKKGFTMYRTFLITLLMALPAGAADSIVDRSKPLAKVTGDYALADGPSWDGRGQLYVPDVKGGTLYRYTPKQKKRSVVVKDAGRLSASCMFEDTLYLCDNPGGRIVRLDGGKLVEVVKCGDGERPNDLIIDKHGGIYFTLTKQGTVMYAAPGAATAVVAAEVNTPNGITMSPDGSTLYVSSFVPKKIWAWDIDQPGKTANGRIIAGMDEGPAKGADGMTVDRAGNVYCAGPTDVWIWSPSGKLLDKITTPARPINCTFGDPEYRTLYITTFDGIYAQQMNSYGKPPYPSTKALPTKNGQLSTAIPDTIHADLDVVYAANGERKMLADMFWPKGEGPHAAVLVIHGGGWLKGDKLKFRALAVELARRGYAACAVEYRLGFEAPFPAGIEDCHAAVRFLRATTDKWKIDPDRIGVVGGSAGGHLAGLLAATADVKALHGSGGHAEQRSNVHASIVMAGPMAMTTGSVAERSRTAPDQANCNHWLRKGVDEAPELYKQADALLHISKTTPPILFMAGEHDKPERNALSREKLNKLGIRTDIKVYKDGQHGCWNREPWFSKMVADMDQFFKDTLK